MFVAKDPRRTGLGMLLVHGGDGGVELGGEGVGVLGGELVGGDGVADDDFEGARAQGELRLLAPRTTLAVADSAYNREDLVAAGFARSSVSAPTRGQTQAQCSPAPGCLPWVGGRPVSLQHSLLPEALPSIDGIDPSAGT